MSVRPIATSIQPSSFEQLYAAVTPAISAIKRYLTDASRWADSEGESLKGRAEWFSLSELELAEVEYGDYIDTVIELAVGDMKKVAQRVKECLTGEKRGFLNLNNLRLTCLPEFLVTGIQRGYFRHITTIDLLENSFHVVPAIFSRRDYFPLLREIRTPA